MSRPDKPLVTHVGWARAREEAAGGGPEDRQTMLRRMDDGDRSDPNRETDARPVGERYAIIDAAGGRVLSVTRIPGGPKTRESIRSAHGRHIPLIGEREHLLVDLAVAEHATIDDVAHALTALATIDPPSQLARTVLFVEGPDPSELTASLSLAGFNPYIRCVRSGLVGGDIDWFGPGQAEVNPAHGGEMPRRVKMMHLVRFLEQWTRKVVRR